MTAFLVAATAPNSFGHAVPETSLLFSTDDAHLPFIVVDTTVAPFLVAATAPYSFGHAVPETSLLFSTDDAHLCVVVDTTVAPFLVAATAPYSFGHAVPETSAHFVAGNAKRFVIPCFTCDVGRHFISGGREGAFLNLSNNRGSNKILKK